MRSIVKPRDGLFIALAIILVGVYVLAGGGGFALDDSWIHQTYARNLATYGEWAFIPGQPSAASTSPLYTVLLATGYVLGVHYTLWTHGLGAVTLALMGIISARMADILILKSKLGPIFVGVSVMLIWQLIWAAASGMETLLFAMLIMWCSYLAWRELHADQIHNRSVALRGFFLGASIALATLARPEGIVLGAWIGVAMLIVRPQQSWQRFLVYGATAIVGFLLLISPYLLLNYQLTGGLLPNTAAAKFVQHEVLLQLPLSTRVIDLFQTLQIGGQALTLPGILIYVVVIARKPNRYWMLYLLPLFWAVSLILIYALRLPAAYQHGRYVMSALPVLSFMGLVGLWFLLDWGQSAGPMLVLRRVLTRVAVIAAFGTILVFALVPGLQAYQRDVAIINEEMVASAKWIDEHIPQSELMAIHDIGAVGYFAPRDDMIDIAGLVSPDIVPIINDADALWQYMEDADTRYLMAFPDQIPGDDPDDPRLCEVFSADGPASAAVDGPTMAIYRLAWDGDCSS
ncbi:MAG: hypothetical protein CL607_13070 [Anaerolineaceae bacterium]|nr:hypothetical protein [Anaerolineaceae bacterium]